MINNRFILPFAILGLSLIVSTFIFSSTWRKIKSENQTITVTGSAKKVIVSDLGVLRGTLSVEASTALEAYRLLQAQKPILWSILSPKDSRLIRLMYKRSLLSLIFHSMSRDKTQGYVLTAHPK